jgi:hypothetical protein
MVAPTGIFHAAVPVGLAAREVRAMKNMTKEEHLDNILDAAGAIHGNMEKVRALYDAPGGIDEGRLWMELRHDLEDALKSVRALEAAEAR